MLTDEILYAYSDVLEDEGKKRANWRMRFTTFCMPGTGQHEISGDIRRKKQQLKKMLLS